MHAAVHRASQVISEHIETDVRVRLGIAPADQEWREEQCPREWFPEKCARTLSARCQLGSSMLRARRDPARRAITHHSPPSGVRGVRRRPAMIKHMAKVRARLKR